jgi:hypothetical protein
VTAGSHFASGTPVGERKVPDSRLFNIRWGASYAKKPTPIPGRCRRDGRRSGGMPGPAGSCRPGDRSGRAATDHRTATGHRTATDDRAAGDHADASGARHARGDGHPGSDYTWSTPRTRSALNRHSAPKRRRRESTFRRRRDDWSLTRYRSSSPFGRNRFSHFSAASRIRRFSGKRRIRCASS